MRSSLLLGVRTLFTPSSSWEWLRLRRQAASALWTHIIMGLLLALLPAAGAVTPLSTAVPGGVIAPKLSVRPPLPEERGKGGILAAAPISCMETIARIPRGLVLAPCDAARAVAAAGGRDPTWASELTAAALLAMHESGADGAALKEWVSSWEAGGWGDGADLGNDEARHGRERHIRGTPETQP